MKKEAGKKISKPKSVSTLTKILIFLFFLTALVFVFKDSSYLTFQQEVEKVTLDLEKELAPLQRDINTLQKELERLQLVEETPQVITEPSHHEEDVLSTFIYARLMDTYNQSKPFDLYVERLLSLPKLGFEKSEDLLWLLDYGKEGKPTVLRLLSLLDQPAEKEEEKKSTISFWRHPIQYTKENFTWDKLFTVRSAKEEEEKAQLKTLLQHGDFKAVLDLLSDSEKAYPDLREALEDLIRSQKILETMEEKIIVSLSQRMNS